MEELSLKNHIKGAFCFSLFIALNRRRSFKSAPENISKIFSMDINRNPKCTYFSIMDHQKGTELNPISGPAIASLSVPPVRVEVHKSKVLSCDFHPSGRFLISSNRDGDIHICDIDHESGNKVQMKGHTGPVTESHFSKDGLDVYSSSVDRTLGIWNVFVGIRTSILKGHTSDVNCVQGASIAYPVLCSGSKDGTVRIWDAREENCEMSLDSGAEVNATCFNENGEYAFSGGIDKDIKIWDLRMCEMICKLKGHTDAVTGLSLSPCGSYILSQSLDSTLRIWNVRPYATSERLIGCFPSNQCKEDGLVRCTWSPDGGMISAGTSDNGVSIWDAISGVKLFELKAHQDSVTDVAFHPNELLMLTASNDNYLYLHSLSD